MYRFSFCALERRSSVYARNEFRAKDEASALTLLFIIYGKSLFASSLVVLKRFAALLLSER